MSATFTGHMSGLFGLDLPPEKWLPYEDINEWLTMFWTMLKRDFANLNSWVDLHATTQKQLDAKQP